MIKEYKDGKSFIDENRDFLLKNPHMTGFFFFDEPLLVKSDKKNFAMKVEEDNKKLLAMKVEPFGLMLYGNKDLSFKMLKYLLDNNFEFSNILCSKDIGGHIVEISKESFGLEYYEGLAMDFMEATSYTQESSSQVEVAHEKDLDQIVGLVRAFIQECNLLEEDNPDQIRSQISNYRLVKLDGKIVSIGAKFEMDENSTKISNVYTLNEYRGSGYSRKIVNTLKNEILESGKTAVLNVDRYNPVTNHLYRELGFKVLFSQGEYRLR